MRILTRTAEPEILKKKSADWTAAFVASGADRPEARKYRHEQVVNALRAMSHNKCFYCERPLSGGDEQVDHYVEVAVDPTRAFAWRNLYLACKGCNVGKPDDRDIPVAHCIDPCGPNPVEEHLEFVDDLVRPVSTSVKGDQTIKKYRLLREPLSYQRLKVLQQVSGEYEVILRRCINEGGRSMNAPERARLLAYADSTAPFSACCAAWLRARGI